MYLILCFGFIINTVVWARPKSIEIWFISPPNRAEFTSNKPKTKLYAARSCQMVGDYCFDPQIGLYEPEGFDKKSAQPIQGTAKGLDVATSLDRELINCDKNNYFDIFCGKSKKEAPSQAKFELWVDTSSSMREMDYYDPDGQCNRSRLVSQLDKTCGFNQKVKVMMFDTSIKQAGTIDSLCVNQGLNDYKRTIDWIERAETQNLVIITDIYEFHKELSDYIESNHGKIKGDKKVLTAAMLDSYLPELVKYCR